jgi:peroxiredoxin
MKRIRTRGLEPDAVIEPLELHALSGDIVRVPDAGQLVHLQFRRFAGCPVCNLHLRSFMRRHAELTAAGIREVAFFHSTAEDLRAYEEEFPFAVIPDPDRLIYRRFGVEYSPRGLLDPRAWPAIVRAVASALVRVVRGERRPPPAVPKGGRYGLPANLLVNGSGRVVASKYGRHIDDVWSVDEVLGLAREALAEGSTKRR